MKLFTTALLTTGENNVLKITAIGGRAGRQRRQPTQGRKCGKEEGRKREIEHEESQASTLIECFVVVGHAAAVRVALVDKLFPPLEFWIVWAISVLIGVPLVAAIAVLGAVAVLGPLRRVVLVLAC